VRAGITRYSDWLPAEGPRSCSSSPGMGKNVLFFTSSTVALGPNQPSIHWVPGALSPGLKQTGRKAHYSQLVLRSRKHSSIRPLPEKPSWRRDYLSMALQPLWALAAFFQFLNLYTVGGTPWTRDQPATYRQDHTNTCLEWDLNPQSQCLSGRRRFVP
jgi:hypothetical protein